MMKKQYITPTVQMYVAEPVSLICASITDVTGVDGLGIGGGGTDELDIITGLSRGEGVWNFINF